MSLDLRIRPRHHRRPWRILWLVSAILLLTSLIAWQRGWRPEQALADLSQDVWPHGPVSVPQTQPRPEQAKADPVVMVTSAVIENPHSNAFTADLYQATGKDIIPWPNVDGRTRVETYVVQSGDTLWSIAARFGLDLDTLRWSNPELERNPDVLSVGTELRILPVAGVYHIVAEGDTIESIAVQYGVAEIDIADYPPNALFPPHDLENGEGLIVPYGRKDLNIPKPSLAPGFSIAWPVVGAVTYGFTPDHPALDVGAPYGATVYAADGGTITYAGWAEEGYGYTIVIDHGDGRQTWYNHLKGVLLAAGNFVTRGTPVGEVGSTGHSSGPHVHFELRIDGERVNPLGYLPSNLPQ